MTHTAPAPPLAVVITQLQTATTDVVRLEATVREVTIVSVLHRHVATTTTLVMAMVDALLHALASMTTHLRVVHTMIHMMLAVLQDMLTMIPMRMEDLTAVAREVLQGEVMVMAMIVGPIGENFRPRPFGSASGRQKLIPLDAPSFNHQVLPSRIGTTSRGWEILASGILERIHGVLKVGCQVRSRLPQFLS